MDTSYSGDIDTACEGCGGDAAGWAFASDGRRVYACADCAGAVERHGEAEEAHPDAQFCRSCGRLTLSRSLTHQHRCPECRHGAGERAEEEAVKGGDWDMSPGHAAAIADAQGAVDWEGEDDAGD